MNNENEYNALAEAVGAVILGNATPGQMLWLEERMATDPAAFEEYERQMEIHANLALCYGSWSRDGAGPRRRFKMPALLSRAAALPFLLLGFLALAGVAVWFFQMEGEAPTSRRLADTPAARLDDGPGDGPSTNRQAGQSANFDPTTRRAAGKPASPRLVGASPSNNVNNDFFQPPTQGSIMNNMHKIAPVLATVAWFAKAGPIEMPDSASTTADAAAIVDSRGGSGGEGPDKLFDRQGNTKWLVGANTGWIAFKFPHKEQWVLTNYWFRAANDSSGRDPKIWQIEGSNDMLGNDVNAVNQANWTVVDDQDIGGILGPHFSWRGFSCEQNTTAYNAYRLNVLQNNGETLIQLGEWTMQGRSGPAKITALPPANVSFETADLRSQYNKDAPADFEFWVVCAPASTGDLGCEISAWQGAGLATKITEPDEGVFTNTVAGLANATEYVARFFASNDVVEAWSRPMVFTTTDGVPSIASRPASAITPTSATVAADLLDVGSGSSGTAAPHADVTLHWGKTPGPPWDHTDIFSAQTAGTISTNLTGLLNGTTYYFIHHVDNGDKDAWSPVAREFTTPGAPGFNMPHAIALADSLVFNATLLDAGFSSATVTCWLREDSEGSYTQVGSATVVAAGGTQTFSIPSGALTVGATYWFYFKAESQMPTGNTVATTTAPMPAVPGVLEVFWDNAAGNNVWDTSSYNWHRDGHANGSTVFTPGNTARFTGQFDGALTHDLTAGNVHIENFGGAYWRLRDNTLTVLGEMRAIDRTGSWDNSLISVLSGPGSLHLKRGVFALDSAANDYTGGTVIHGGHFTGNSFGPGAFTFGGPDPSTATANLYLGVPVNHPLVLAGPQNTGRLHLSTAAHFSGLSENNGGTLQVFDNGNALTIDGTDGLLPPYVVKPGGEFISDYMESKNGTLQTVANYADYPEVFVYNGNALESNSVYSAARVLRHFDLGGHTLEINGALIRNMDPYSGWGTPLEVHNGTLMLPGENAWFHIDDPNWQCRIRATLTGPARFVKFGPGRVNLYDFGDRDFAAQQGDLALWCESPSGVSTVSGELAGSGRIVKEGPGSLALTHPEPVNVNGLAIYGGELVIHGGAAKAFNLDIGAVGSLALLDGASLTGLENFNWAGRPAPSTITLSPGSLLEAVTFYVGIRGGDGWNFYHNNTCVVRSSDPGVPGGTLDMRGGAVVVGRSAWGMPSYNNNTVIFDNVTLLNAQLNDRYSGAKDACNIIFTNNAAGHISNMFIADEGGWNAHWQVNTGSKLFVSGTIGVVRYYNENNVLEINGPGSEIIHSGALWVDEGAQNANQNGILVANGGRYTHVGPGYYGASIAMPGYENNNRWATRNFIRATGPGSVFDGGGFLGVDIAGGQGSYTDFANNRFSTHNRLVAEDGALMDNLRYINLACPWWDTRNPSSNSVAVATGAIVNCGPVTVGNGLAFDNILRLAGGTLNAASLTMHQNNILDVQIQANGLPESRVAGVAAFGVNTRLVLSAVKGAPFGRFDVLTADDGVEGFENLVLEVVPEHKRSCWRHGLDNGGKTLYVRHLSQGTIFMVR